VVVAAAIGVTMSGSKDGILTNRPGGGEEVLNKPVPGEIGQDLDVPVETLTPLFGSNYDNEPKEESTYAPTPADMYNNTSNETEWETTEAPTKGTFFFSFFFLCNPGYNSTYPREYIFKTHISSAF
jgi:hypothetical protein